MPTGVETVTVEPADATSALASNFTGNLAQYKTGDSITVTVFARDQYENLRSTSESDNFKMLLKGQTDGKDYEVGFVKNGDGTYTASMMFEVA